ncbi:MAG: SprT family zinc-dependent metalloprotease, partial [Steroidobacteraceae bacterium]
MCEASKIHEIAVPEGTLRYELRWTARRRTIGIAVEPDRRVVVLAPRDASAERVTTLVMRRIGWIRRQWSRLDSLPPSAPPRQWVQGETHRYLGRQYRLRIQKSDVRAVRLQGAYFVVSLPAPRNREAVRGLMEAWYWARGDALLRARVALALKATTWLDVSSPPILVRALRRKWGSTSPSGRVTFNVEIVKVPLPCIDYVVAHELVHLRIPNHSPAFWRMLDRVMPDWKRWRERLAVVEI